jgi:type I restriction-modification system DNA methylase subunit
MAKHFSETRTEDLIKDLLFIQSWLIKRPPKGNLIRQNEYKDFSHLEEIFKGKSKSGGKGDAYPDFLIVDKDTSIPQIIIEAKANKKDFTKALNEACNNYGNACYEAGYSVIAIGIAGQEETGISIGVSRYNNGNWERITYNGNPISWIPTPDDVLRLLPDIGIMDLTPIVPSPEVLASKGDIINRILREATVKDEYRPAYVGAMMLGLWESKGSIRRNPEFILDDINQHCEQAFSRSGKPELSRSLRIDEANKKLAASAWRVISELEKLNVVSASFDHDYLGQLYETFFRYTGGNTIGQYFTPRHITKFMADLCETTADDLVIDPSCGTGGFLVACIHRALETSKQRYEVAVDMIKNKLIGYESEPVTAALCVANMILRGDGKTGIRKEDCFLADDYPENQCQVALMNPPFPHKDTDVSPEEFVERALKALETRGKLAVILPTSLIVKKPKGVWRESILETNTLLAVCQLPDELFQPYASCTTSVILLEKGISHNPKRKTVFVRLHYDGLTLKKGTRVNRADGKNQIPDAINAVINKMEEPGFSGTGSVSGKVEWSPGEYICSALPEEQELKESIDELMRRLSSFYIRYAVEIARQRDRVEAEELTVSPYPSMLTKKRIENATSLPKESETIGELFDIFYGQKELHSREGIPPGDSLIVSPTEQYNGCYGWLTFEPLIKAPFVTVAQTGSIGEAFVQMEPCGVNDDCLILLPREDKALPISCLFIAAAIIRLERWRFSYGRKLTPQRISSFRMSRMPNLERWVESQFQVWSEIIEAAIKSYV